MMKKVFVSKVPRTYVPVFLWTAIIGLIISQPLSSGAETVSPKTVQPRPISDTWAIDNPASVLEPAQIRESEKQIEDIQTAKERLDAGTSDAGIRQRASDSAQAASPLRRFKVRLRPNVGTPRQIRGGVLQDAFTASGSIRERDKTTARNFMNNCRDLLLVEQPDSEFFLRRYQSDAMNRRHLRYSQTYGDIPVWPAEVNVHLNADGDVDLMNGVSVPTPAGMTTEPILTAKDAAERARVHMAENGESDAGTVTDGPELIIYAPGHTTPRLSWKLTLSFSADSQWVVVVDALDGTSLTAYNQVTSASVAGSGTDLFGEQQSLDIWEEDGLYYMVNTGKAMYDAGKSDPPDTDAVFGGIIILDADNQPATDDITYIPPVEDVVSADPDAGWIPDAVSAAANFSETYDYYLERHSRNSIDGEGGSIYAVVRLGQDYNNAFWNSETQVMYFGDARPYAGALDVVAHELTHGVTSNTANLIYQNQPGALNEAFSDIFGEMTEARTNGAPDWVIGTMLSEPLRSMKNPGAYSFGYGLSYPSRMSEYFSTSEDNGGVHINLTIVTHAFYQLAQGLNGAIGIRDAERIFYRALVYHLVRASQFTDARFACISSAEELFGEDSAQAIKTAEAFDAVEIYDDTDSSDDTDTGISVVSGEDALLFVYSGGGLFGRYYLGRREGDDPARGIQLSGDAVTPAKPSVSGDGTMAVFVNQLSDLCLIDTETGQEECMGWFDVNSVAMSPDTTRVGFVLQGEENLIRIYDETKGEIQAFELVAPTFSENNVSINTILRADAMTFTSDNRYIIYDALNVLELNDGSQVRAWSIYAIDLETEQTLVIVPPVSGLNIGYPALGHTSDQLLAYSVYDEDSNISTLYAQNLETGEVSAVGEVSEFPMPSYTGDDRAIVYPKPDSTSTGYSLWQQPLDEDRLTPLGGSSLYLSDASYGVIYRRGDSSSSDDESVPREDSEDEPEEEPQEETENESSSDDGGGGGGGCFISATGGNSEGPFTRGGSLLLAIILFVAPSYRRLGRRASPVSGKDSASPCR